MNAKSKTVVKYESIAPEKTQKAIELIEGYIHKEHPMDAMMQMLGVKPTKPAYQVVANQVRRSSYPEIDMKIVSVASCLPGEDIAANDTQKIARLALQAIQHYASISNVQAFFLTPYYLRTKTVIEGSTIPLEEQCRLYAGVENLLLEIYDELPQNGTITDKIVVQKIASLTNAK